MKTAAKMKKTAEKILSEILQDSRITNYLDMLKGQSEGRYTHCINVRTHFGSLRNNSGINILNQKHIFL